MRRSILFLGLLAGLVLTPALAQENPYEGVDPSGQTVTFWHVHDGPNGEVLEEIVQEFNETNEYGITVVAENQGNYGDLFQKMLPVLATDDMPQMLLAYQNQAATYQLADALIDMRPLVESEQWGYSEEELGDFFEGFVKADVFPSFGGAQLGWPPNRSMEVMFYNQSWLEELGYDEFPQTPEEFREVACAAAENPFSDAQGEAAIGYEISVSASTFASWVFAFGGDIYDAENNRYTYDSPEAIEAMNFLQGLIEDGCAAIETEQYGAQANFGIGTTFTATGSSVGIPYYERAVESGANFGFDVTAFPHTTPDPAMNVYGPSVSITQAGTPESQLAAWLFLKHYTSPEAQAKWARVTNYFPVRESVAENLGDYFEANPKYATAFELLQYGTAEPATPGYDFVRDLVNEAMAAIFTGDDVEETLTDLNEESNDILLDQLSQMQ
ncbi:MAG TPA: ABC transporter substrate-binding protein [Trueperaceae bacterium]